MMQAVGILQVLTHLRPTPCMWILLPAGAKIAGKCIQGMAFRTSCDSQLSSGWPHMHSAVTVWTGVWGCSIVHKIRVQADKGSQSTVKSALTCPRPTSRPTSSSEHSGEDVECKAGVTYPEEVQELSHVFATRHLGSNALSLKHR